MLVRVSGDKLDYRPIAGTRPRGQDEQADRNWKTSYAMTKRNVPNT